MPLPLAAALAFHEAYRSADRILPRPEYDDALNLTAAALSRLISIYTIDERTRTPVVARLNLRSGKFRDGAAVYEHRMGNAMTSLLVRREQLLPAVEIIKSTGIPFRSEGDARPLSRPSER